MIEKTEFDNYKELLIFIGAGLILISYLIYSSGIITPDPEPVINITTPVPTPTPAPTIITPEPTPSALPTIEQVPVDPYAPGMRSENQWFKFWRVNASFATDLHVGIVPYRHAWLDRYSWWNDAQGNFFQQNPDPGMRYFAVWIHEESFDGRLWGFDETAFRLQINDQLYAPDTGHNPVNRIQEFDYLDTYYDTTTAGPFSYLIRYTGTDPKTGGFAAERLGYIRPGRENGFDGYILFQVPTETKTRDIILLGNFASFGSAQWTFRD